MKLESTKIIELGSCAFRQWKATSHCKFVHGYRLIAKYWFGCAGLDDKNWVVDFGGLKELKQVLEKQFDHTLCISSDDPLLESFKALNEAGGCDLRIMDGVGMEKFAQYCFNVGDAFIREKTVGRCWVEKVEVWEHEKNSTIVQYNLADILPSRKDPQKAVQHIEKQKLVNEIPSATEIPPAHKQENSDRPAPLRNNVTTGWSNLFGGTSWGT